MEEYARTEFGIYKVIGKYERSRGDNLCVQLGDFYTGEFKGEEYESNLKLGNLIGLLEVGDYVNLERILDITEEYIRTTETIHNKSWLAKNITSILTHELYEANAYKVKGE